MFDGYYGDDGVKVSGLILDAWSRSSKNSFYISLDRLFLLIYAEV